MRARLVKHRTRHTPTKQLLNSLFVFVVLMLTGCASIAPQQIFAAYIPPSATLASLPEEQPTLQATTSSTHTETAAPTLLPTATYTPAPSATPSETPFVYAYGPQYFPTGIDPLTGLPVENQSLLERRPIVIKVTNFPRAVRPQWGLSQADHVYEYYIGDSMSRFVGVFYGKDAERVGPIRSARLFDEHLMRMYNAIFIFGWADDPILQFLFAPDILPHLIVERDNNCPPLCRIGPKAAYNTLFANTAQIGTYLEDRGTNNDPQDLTGLRFELDVPNSGNPGEQFFIQYSIVSYNYWKYDPVSERYLRFQETEDNRKDQKNYEPLTDSLNGEQLSADNVLVLKVPHTVFYQSRSTTIYDQLIDGKGYGYAFRNGQIYPITWVHDQNDKLMSFILPNGDDYPLKPGNVWVEIIGVSSDLTSLADGSWSFDFAIP